MSDDHVPTAQEKLQFVAEQIAANPPGQRLKLDCPYCFGRTRRGEEFCCETLLKAFEAILDANEQLRINEFMDRAMDRHLNN